MPLTHSLDLDGDVVIPGGASAGDAQNSERFTVKDGMNYWVNVNYAHPERATKLLLGGETIDTDDQTTIDILMRAPEITYVGNTP